MGSERRSMPEQELSIREREEQLFVELDQAPVKLPDKPFPMYLRETPADPTSSGVKAILWIVGIVVVLLFAAALWRTQRTSRLRRTPAAKTSSIPVNSSVSAQSRYWPRPACGFVTAWEQRRA